LLDEELHDVGDRLQEAPGTDPVGADPGLDEAEDLPLGEHQVGDDREDAQEDQDEDLDRRRDRPVEEVVPHRVAERVEEAAHRSTSPSTMSVVPTIATRSAIRAPFDISGTTWRVMNEGARTWQRYRCEVPSPTM